MRVLPAPLGRAEPQGPHGRCSTPCSLGRPLRPVGCKAPSGGLLRGSELTLLQQRGMQPPGGRRGQKASSSSVEGGGVDDSAGYCDHGPKYGKDDADNGEDTAEAHGREEVKSGISSGDTMDTQGPLSPERLQSGGEDEHPLQAASSTPTGMQPPSSAFLEWRPVLRHVLQQAIGGVLSMAVDHTIKIVKQTTRAYINQPAAMSPLPSLPQHILGPEQSTQLVAAEMFLTTVALSVFRPLLLHAIPVKMVPNSELYKELHNRMLSGTENTAFVKLVAHHMAARDIWCTVPEDLILKAALHHSLACMARAAGEQHAKDKGCYDVAMAAEDAVLEAFSWPTISLRRKVCTQVCPVEADTFSTEAAIRELLGELLGLEFGDAVAQVHTMCSWEAEEGSVELSHIDLMVPFVFSPVKTPRSGMKMHAGRTQGGKPRQSKKKEAKGRKSKATATNGVAGTHLDWAGDVPYSALSHKDILVYVISTVVHLVTAHTGQTDGVCVLCKKESLHSSRILNGLRGELLFDVCSGVEELLPVSAMQTAWKKHMNEEISKEEASALVGMFGYDIIIVLNVRRISTDQDLLDAFSSGKDKSWLVYERLTEAVAHKIPRAASMLGCKRRKKLVITLNLPITPVEAEMPPDLALLNGSLDTPAFRTGTKKGFDAAFDRYKQVLAVHDVDSVGKTLQDTVDLLMAPFTTSVHSTPITPYITASETERLRVMRANLEASMDAFRNAKLQRRQVHQQVMKRARAAIKASKEAEHVLGAMREIVPDLINYKSWMASASTTRWETPGELLAAVEMLEGPISAMRALQREHPDLASYLPPEPYADVVASIIATAWNELGASWKAVFEEGLDGLPRLRGALNELFAVLRSPVSQRALGMPKEGDSFGRLLEQLAVYDALAKELTVLEVELRALDAEVGNVMQEIEEVTKVFRAEDGDAEAVDAARRWLEQAAVKLEAAATGAELRLAEVSIQGTAGHKGMQECLQATLYCRGRAKCCRLLLELRLALDNKLGEKAQGLLLEAREEGLPVDWAESELADLIWAINQVMRAKDSGSAGPSMFAPEDLKGNWVEAGGGIAYDDGDLLGQGSLQTYVFRGQFRATDRASNERPAAIKRIVLRPGEQGKKDWSLIMREVELFRDMSSSGRVCQLYGYASNQEFVYLAMELCQEDLRSHIKREGAKIGTDRRLKLLEQIGNAVKDMHTHNPPLAHNDLKPDNILITPSGEARISDMGLSVKVDKDLEIFSMATFKEKGREINLTGRAPEVQEGLKDLTLAVDVWQLAVVFYHVLTGRGSPFLPEEAEEVAGKGKGEMSRIDTKKREQLLLNQQDRAIQEGAFDLRALEGSGLLDEQTALEARTLLSAMLSRNPSDRPTVVEVLKYPLFWTEMDAMGSLMSMCKTISDKSVPRSLVRAAVTQVVGRNALMTPLSAWKEILSPQLTGQYFEFQQNMQSEYPRDLQGLIRFARNALEHPPEPGTTAYNFLLSRGGISPGRRKVSDQRLRGEIAEYLVETLPSLPTALHMLELELAAGLQSPA